MNGLRGALVLDLSTTAVGSLTTRLMAESHAYVIRPELHLEEVSSSMRWRLRHRGKRIVSSAPEAAIRALVGKCDLVVADRQHDAELIEGISSYCTLRLRRTHNSSSLLGDDPIPDFGLSAIGGLTYVTGDPAGVPCTPKDLIATRLSALYAACVGSAALVHGLRNSNPSFIDLYVAEAVSSCLECILPTYFVDNYSIPRALHMNDIAWPVTVYRTTDAWVGVSCGRMEDTHRFLDLLGLGGLVDKSLTDFSQLQDIEVLDQKVAAQVGGWKSDQLVTACQARRVAAATAIAPKDIVRDEQALGDRFVASWQDGTPVLRSPVRTLSGSAIRKTPPVPQVIGRLRRAAVTTSPPGIGPSMDGLLDGRRVLDFTWALAGPFATMILADLGADVAKVESPNHVDSARLVGPYIGSPDIEKSGYFRFFNRNKRSVEFDLNGHLDRGRLLDLASAAHLVIENFRPGSLDDKGLGYAHLRQVKPDVAMCSVSGFGRSGPRVSWASYGGAMAECANGLAMATGGDRPIIPGKAIADLFAGLYAALGACSQIYQQERHGVGSYVEVTQFEAGASTLDELLTVGPESSERHQMTGSDARGWSASNELGSWPIADAAHVAQDLEENMAIQRFGEAGSEDLFLGLPASIDGKRVPIRRRSPNLGEHTRDVLQEWSTSSG